MAFEAVDEGEALRSALLCSRREVEISWMRLSWRLTTRGKLDLLVAITERRFDRHGGNGEAWSTGQGKTAGIREEIDLGTGESEKLREGDVRRESVRSRS